MIRQIFEIQLQFCLRYCLLSHNPSYFKKSRLNLVFPRLKAMGVQNAQKVLLVFDLRLS